jgi:hypothetical protein
MHTILSGGDGIATLAQAVCWRERSRPPRPRSRDKRLLGRTRCAPNVGSLLHVYPSCALFSAIYGLCIYGSSDIRHSGIGRAAGTLGCQRSSPRRLATNAVICWRTRVRASVEHRIRRGEEVSES